MVPALVIHCVREVEDRGLTEPGIYRLSGSDKDVKALKVSVVLSKLFIVFFFKYSTLSLIQLVIILPLVYLNHWL